MKRTINKKALKYILNGLTIVVGTFLMGFAFNVLLDANKISPAGFAGLCSIVSNLIEANLGVAIPASVFYLAINAVLFFLSLKTMGLNFAINSAIGILSYSVFMEVCTFDIGLDPTNPDLLLCAIFGGLIMGIGLGLVFRGKGSTGGSDMLANLLTKKFKFITVGNLVLVVDIVVLVLSYIAYGNLQFTLYSLVAIFIMTKVCDMIVSGVQGVRAYYIISHNHEKISKELMEQMHRGVTAFNAQGMHSGNKIKMLMILVTNSQAVKLRQIVGELDPSAFVYSTSVSEAMGNGFLPLTKTKKIAKKKIKNIKENANNIKLEINNKNIEINSEIMQENTTENITNNLQE
ncbi:MAG: YitT family protein [Clostridiales bacterium]|nr:YitT family protein [Clostridiales bacterium]